MKKWREGIKLEKVAPLARDRDRCTWMVTGDCVAAADSAAREVWQVRDLKRAIRKVLVPRAEAQLEKCHEVDFSFTEQMKFCDHITSMVLTLGMTDRHSILSSSRLIHFMKITAFWY